MPLAFLDGSCFVCATKMDESCKRYREIFDEQICHAMAFRGCFVFGFEEGGGGGEACTSSKLFPTRCCHRLSSKVCRGSLEKVER